MMQSSESGRPRSLPPAHAAALRQILPMACVGLDMQCRLTSWNLAAERLFGRSLDEAHGQMLFGLIVPDAERARLTEYLRRLTHDVRIVRWDGWCLEAGGHETRCEWTMTPRLADDGSLAGADILCRRVEMPTSAAWPGGEALLDGALRPERTDRETRLEQIERRRRFLDAILDQMDDFVSVVDLDRRVRLVNAAYARRIGQPAEAMVGRHFQDPIFGQLFRSDGAPVEAEERIASRILRGEPATVERRLVTPDGREIWMIVSASPLRDRTGAIVGSVSIGHDITRRKRAEEEREDLLATIAREHQRLNTILKHLPHTLLILDADGRFVEVNDACLAAMGMPREQIVGRNVAELPLACFDDDGRPLDGEELPVAWALRGVERAGQMQVQMADGRRIWAYVSAAPMRNDQGAVTGAILIAQDITGRRQALAALQASEATNRALLDAIPDSYYRIRRDGQVLAWKAGVNSVPEWTPARGQQVGRNLHELVPPPMDEEMLVWIEQVLDTGEALIREYALPTASGPAYREARFVRLGTDEVLGLVRNIDSRKRAELALRALNEELEQRVRERAAELEAVNRQLDAYSYSVSHDLRAPLRAIDGYAQFLDEDYASRLDDEGQTLLASVRTAATQLQQLIEGLLAYARIERQIMEMSPVALDATVAAVLATYEHDIEVRGVRLSVKLDAETVHADRGALALILHRLIDNALRFTMPAAEPHIEIGCERRGGSVRLWVKDNGIGFDMQYHDRVFGLFERLHRHEEYAGSGVGLALVRKAVQRMAGRVWADSSPGDGATFYVELPG